LRTRIFSRLTALAAGLLMCGALAAQPPAGGPPADAPRWGKERIETVIIGKFSSELNLTPEQAEKFFPRFRQLQNQVEDMQRAGRDRRDQLDQLSKDPNADKGKVNELLAQNAQDQERMLKLKQEFLGDVGSFLSPQQIGRCSILMDELPQRIRQFIEERRGRDGDDRPGGGRGRGRHSGY
jgi:Spy/CpxP family protein refolding chaperone